MSKKFLKKGEETVVKFSAQSENFSVLVVKGLTNCCCFGWSFGCFSCFKTLKLPVSILKRNNRNKRLVSDSAETSFGYSFGCFDTKLVLEDTLGVTDHIQG
jgi:hypothetical protein